MPLCNILAAVDERDVTAPVTRLVRPCSLHLLILTRIVRVRPIHRKSSTALPTLCSPPDADRRRRPGLQGGRHPPPRALRSGHLTGRPQAQELVDESEPQKAAALADELGGFAALFQSSLLPSRTHFFYVTG